MKIALFSPQQYPSTIGVRSGYTNPARTGDCQLLIDLQVALTNLGHAVSLLGPSDAFVPDMFDVMHDWTTEKKIAERYPNKTVSTLLGGMFDYPRHGLNVVTQCEQMRWRAAHGYSDYHDTPLHGMSPNSTPLPDTRVVFHGIDTEFYAPDPTGRYDPGKPLLFIGRWHPARGWNVAIEIAQATGIKLTMAGCHPDDETEPYQADQARQAMALASGLPNVRFVFLPPDPYHHATKKALYHHSSGLLNTLQFHEPGGLTQMEALACGIPVYTLDLGSSRETITGDVGFVARDASQLARAVSENVYAYDQRTCRAEAVSRFDRHIMAQNYLKLYQQVLDGKGWGGR